MSESAVGPHSISCGDFCGESQPMSVSLGGGRQIDPMAGNPLFLLMHRHIERY